jgi:hypothetical protein
VLLSLVYRLLRSLFGLLAALARSDLSKDAEPLVLRHENQVLRRTCTGRRRSGRPSTGIPVKALIVGMAGRIRPGGREDPG